MIITDSGIRRTKVYVSYFNNNGDTCTRVINTTMSADQVKECLPIKVARIERRVKK
jgi:hypothetical protein